MTKKLCKVNTLIEKMTKPTFFHSEPGIRRLQTVIDFEQIVGQKLKITPETLNLAKVDLDGKVDGVKRRPIAVLTPLHEHSEFPNNIAHIVVLQQRLLVNGINEYKFKDSDGNGKTIHIRNQANDQWKIETEKGQFMGFNLLFKALDGDKLELNHELFEKKPKTNN